MAKRAVLLGLLLLVLLSGWLGREPVPAEQPPLLSITTPNRQSVVIAAKREIVAAEPVVPQPRPVDLQNMSEAEKLQKYRRANNFLMADPSLDPQMVQARQQVLANYLWGEGSPVPDLTADDLQQQAAIRVEIEQLRAATAAIQQNRQLSVEARQQAVRELLEKFLQATGG